VCVQNANQPFQMSLRFHTRPEALTSKDAEIQYGIPICRTLYYKAQSRLRFAHVCPGVNQLFQVSSWFCIKPLAINSKVSVTMVQQFAIISLFQNEMNFSS